MRRVLLLLRAMKKGAAHARFNCAAGTFCLLVTAGWLAGCSALPSQPARANLYDFGPGVLPTSLPNAAAPLPPLAPLAIADVATAGGALDNQAVLYRLAYDEAQELRPYSLARWSAPPAQLVRQRLRENLGQRRAIFDARGGLALNRTENPVLPLQLRLDLDEFSHFFSAPDSSVGLIRLRATVVEITSAGERLAGQRNFVVQRPATTPNAAGGVRALTAATDAVIAEIDTWLQQLPPRTR